MKREFDNEKKLYTLSLLVKDIPGVMSQVSRLFSRKGYNIESIATGASNEPGVTRITIVIKGDELMIDQIATQCRKLLPVLAVKVLDADSSLQREVALIKVQADDMMSRGEIIQIAELFRANIIDVSRDALTVATFGTEEKVEALMNLLQEFGILEVVRTGTIAIERGRSTIYDQTKLKEEYNYGKNVL
ncbi:MAG: acetolactate synthase small subunit [Clostridiales bacterium]|nr:acetolactate synthase small subunit [Clostridiales bacterium]